MTTPPASRPPHRLVAAVLVLLAGVGTARGTAPQAGTPLGEPQGAWSESQGAWVEREVLDMALQSTIVRVQSVSATEVVARTRDGRPVRFKLGDILALATALEDTSLSQQGTPGQRSLSPASRPTPQPRLTDTPLRRLGLQPARAEPLGLVLLSDGQTLAGTRERDPAILRSLAPSGFREQLPWRNPAIGSLLLSLEGVVAANFFAQRFDIAGTTSADTATLRNGDIASGFLDVRWEPGTPEPTLSIEEDAQAGEARQLPIRRVDALTLGNPLKRAGGSWVWLSDGSVLRVHPADSTGPGIQLNNDRGALVRTLFPAPGSAASRGETTPTRTLSMNAREVLAFAPRRERFEPLATLPSRSQSTDPTRRWTAPPNVGDPLASPLGAPDIELPGPMSVTWTLPPEALRIAGVAELPASARAWGDCEVRVLDVQGQTLWTTRLSAQSPNARFNLPLEQGMSTVTMRVDAGNHGPIDDRVLLRRALVLIADPAR